MQNKPVSFVYPFMEKLAQGDELKRSIRSLCKHVKFDFEVVIVGDKPAWYQGKFIPTDKVRGVRFARAFDIANKLKTIAYSDEISEDFVYLYDDVYLVNDCTIDDFKKVIALEPLPEKGEVRVGSNVWRLLMRETHKSLGLDKAYNYETHIPRMLNKKKLDLILKAYELKTRPMLFSTLYYNEYFERPDVVLTEKNEYKAGIYNAIPYNKIEQECRNKKFLNHSENAYRDSMIRFLETRFNEKSQYEL
jgi:hypothetical protein